MNYAIEVLERRLNSLTLLLPVIITIERKTELKSQIAELERAIKELSPKGKQYVSRKDIVDGKSKPLFVKYKPYTSPEKNKLICENGAIVGFTDVELEDDFTEIREG